MLTHARLRTGRRGRLAGASVGFALAATLGGAAGTGCARGTRVVLEVVGQGVTGLTGLDVTFTNETETGSIRIPEVGEKEELALPVTFGIRLHDGIPGNIQVCVRARGATTASGCSDPVPLAIGGRTALTAAAAWRRAAPGSPARAAAAPTSPAWRGVT